MLNVFFLKMELKYIGSLVSCRTINFNSVKANDSAIGVAREGAKGAMFPPKF